MACEKKIKICLSPYCSVNYEAIMTAQAVKASSSHDHGC